MFTKKLHYFAEKITRPIEKYIEVVIYRVHNKNGGMADERAVDEIDGKGYVHYKSWQETYEGLIDDEYLKNMTEEKCKAIAHKWTNNILVAKDGDKVIGFVGYGKYRDDTLK